MNGDGVVLTSFGAPLLLLIWGIFVQDVTLDDAARSRSHRPPPLHGQFFSAWVLWVLMTALLNGSAA